MNPGNEAILAGYLAAVTDRGGRPWTVTKYRYAGRRFLGHVEAVGGWPQLTPDDILAYLRTFTARSTRRFHWAVAHGLCDWLVARRELSGNPAHGLKLPRPERRLPKVITDEEWQGLLHSCKRYSKKSKVWEGLCLLYLLRYSGLRVHEAVGYKGERFWDAYKQAEVRKDVPGLRIGDLDLFGKTARVRGKGGREEFAMLSDATVEALRAFLRPRHLVGADPSALLFVTTDGRPRGAKWAQSRLTAFGRRAHLARTITPHMLRHTFATSLLEAGADIRAIQRLMRHTDIQSTLVYADFVNKGALRAQFDKGKTS